MAKISMLSIIKMFFPVVSVSRSKSEHFLLLPTTNTSCPPWTTVASDNSCHCEFKENSVVQCVNNNLTVTFPLGYCISYNDHFNTTILGYCLLSHVNNSNPVGFEQRYEFSSTNDNVSQLNDDFCNELLMNRTGQLCGKCKDGFAPPVYSYSLACVDCTDYKYNWIKYVAVAYLPLTVFHVLVIIVFRVSATSGLMNGYTTTSQMVAFPMVLRLVAATRFDRRFVKFVAKALVTFYGISNLDFFRSMYAPFCIHPDTTRLQVLALDYAVAVYPLLLVVITYIFASLHYRYPRVVSLWRPFYKVFRYIRDEWDIKNSLIEAFATFILLSYVKILTTSLELLTPVIINDMNGHPLPQRYLRVDGTVKYFGTQHLPYSLLALLMILVFNFLPLLLCLYPCRCFHKCLNCCKIQSLLLHTFMDIIHAPFKIQPRDCRYFAGMYLTFRIANLLLYSVTNGFLYFTYGGIVTIMAILFVVIGRPYRVPFHNTIDIIFFCILTLLVYEFPCTIFQDIYDTDHHDVANTVWYIFYALVFSAPALYGTCILVYTITPRQKMAILLSMISRNLKKWVRVKSGTTDSGSDTSEGPRPHRLEHSDEYPPLEVDMERVSNYQACQNITISNFNK